MLDSLPLVTIINIHIKKVCKHERVPVITLIRAAPMSGLALLWTYCTIVKPTV